MSGVGDDEHVTGDSTMPDGTQQEGGPLVGNDEKMESTGSEERSSQVTEQEYLTPPEENQEAQDMDDVDDSNSSPALNENGISAVAVDSSSADHDDIEMKPADEMGDVNAESETAEPEEVTAEDMDVDLADLQAHPHEPAAEEQPTEDNAETTTSSAPEEDDEGKTGEGPPKPEEGFNDARDTLQEGEVEDVRTAVGDDVEAGNAPKDEDAAATKKVELPYSIRGRQPPRDGSEFEASSRGYRETTSDAGIHDGGSDIGAGGRSDALRDIAPGASFLEALTEEERRLRTRYLPDVDGIRMLHKSEIKRDLSLARSVISSTGVAGTLSSSKKKSKKAQARSSDEDRMDVDEEEGSGETEDDRASDISSRIGGSNIDLETKDLSILSGAFIAPPDDSVVPTNGDTSDSRESQSSVPTRRWQAPSRSPLVVESITAYNPPRPAESSGPKKKHRMLRWERSPQAAENELRALQQTVQNIRGELHRAENERERLETVNSVLRTHFLSQLNALKSESVRLNDELAAVQVDCVKAADLLTSRTRSRGVGKGVYVMRDVLSVLKTRGASLTDKNIVPTDADLGTSLSGVGGVSAASFVDWDFETTVKPNSLASAWILPGDNVQTPYGDGVALRVFGPSNLDVSESPVEYSRPKPASPNETDAGSDGLVESSTRPSAPSVEGSPAKSHGFGGNEEDKTAATEPSNEQDQKQGSTNGDSAPAKVSSSPVVKEGAKRNDEKDDGEESNKTPAKSSKESEKKQASETESNDGNLSKQVLLPRVCVRLPFGLGFFPLDAVTSKEDPSAYSDAMLSARWKKMVDVAALVGSCIDVAGMENEMNKKEVFVRLSGENDSDEASAAAGSRHSDNERVGVDPESFAAPAEAMEENETEGGVDTRSGGTDAVTMSELMGEHKTARSSFVPLGASMLPTASGRGALFPTASIPTLEKGVNSAFYDFSDVLGKPNNPGMPEGVRNWEGQRYETCILQAKVLQLRNELYRQRRIRTLNERTFVTSRDRSHRVENLLAEMRSDLKSLKGRLEDELFVLGIDEEKAENLLAAYYKDKENVDLATTEATPPPKRKRKLTKEQPQLEPKHTRRRAADAAEDALLDDQGPSGESDDRLSGRMSGDDIGMDQSSDDDADSRRAHKRSRVAA